MSKVNLELLKALEDILVDLKIRASLTYEPEVLDVSCSELIRARNAIDRAKCLLLAKPEPEPLSDDEICNLYYNVNGAIHKFARAIEKAHGIGGENE